MDIQTAGFEDVVALSKALGRGFDFKISGDRLIVGYGKHAIDLETPVFSTDCLREYEINLLACNIKMAHGILHRDARPPGLFPRGTNRANDTYYG